MKPTSIPSTPVETDPLSRTRRGFWPGKVSDDVCASDRSKIFDRHLYFYANSRTSQETPTVTSSGLAAVNPDDCSSHQHDCRNYVICSHQPVLHELPSSNSGHDVCLYRCLCTQHEINDQCQTGGDLCGKLSASPHVKNSIMT